MDLAGLADSFPRAERVLLKPNLLSARKPEEAVTTHPAVVGSLAGLAVTAGCAVALGDSPPFAGENPGRYARLCEQTGMTGVAVSVGAELLRFEENVTTVHNQAGRFYKSFELGQAVLDADLIVNIPKLKTHGLTTYTGAIKNLFGCVPGVRKGLFHVQAAEDREVFAQMLVDLLGAMPPAIHVMDAIVGMEGEGPNSGKPRAVGLVMASSDPVALDAVACAVVGIDPMSVDTTRLAHEQGLGCGDIALIEIRGEELASVAIQGFSASSGANQWVKIPKPVRKALRRQLIPSPRISASKCVGCGDCARACPVNAISSGNPPPLDLSKCIRCYCCHEVCNREAIELKRGWLGNLLFGGRTKKRLG